MFSNPNFEWEQSIKMKKNTFSAHFEQANQLSEAMALPITVMHSDHQVGVFYSTQAYNKLLKQIKEMKQEILILKKINRGKYYGNKRLNRQHLCKKGHKF